MTERTPPTKYDIVALGEALIDMTTIQVNGELTFRPAPGGAPLNLLAMAAKLGRKTAFIGKVGKDGFGQILQDTMLSFGISTNGLIESEEYNTPLAFVHLDADGERSFSFYRKGYADVGLTEEEVDHTLPHRKLYYLPLWISFPHPGTGPNSHRKSCPLCQELRQNHQL